MENVILEFENIKKEISEIFDRVMSDELSIEECRNLLNKLVFLCSKSDALSLNFLKELKVNGKKRSKKSLIFLIIQIVLLILSFIKLIVPTFFIPSPVISVLILCNVINMYKNNLKTKKDNDVEHEMTKNFVSESEKLDVLINNCIRFLNKKIELVCGAPEEKEISEEKLDEMYQNFNLMFVNNLIISLIYNDGTIDEISPGMEKIAVSILQTDLQTDECDLNVLIKMARSKVKNELDFTRTLHKNDKKSKKF